MSESQTQPDPATEQLLNTGRLVHALARDPKFRPRVLGLIKDADPSVSIPELDVAAEAERRASEGRKPLEEAVKGLTETVAGLQKQLQRGGFRETFGLSEDELVEVETFAADAGITKGDKAVDLWRKTRDLGVPRGTHIASGMSDDDRKAYLRAAGAGPGVLKDLVMKNADRVIREIRGGRR